MTAKDKSPSKPREMTPGIRILGLSGSEGNDGTVLFCCLTSKYETLNMSFLFKSSVFNAYFMLLTCLRRQGLIRDAI